MMRGEHGVDDLRGGLTVLWAMSECAQAVAAASAQAPYGGAALGRGVASATFRLANAGKIRFQTAVGGAFDEQAPFDEWLEAESSAEAANYEVYAWKVSGDTPNIGVLEQWQRLDVARDWGLTRSTAGTSEALIAMHIRRVGTTAGLAFADITLRAVVIGGTLPPSGSPFLTNTAPSIDGQFYLNWFTTAGATYYQVEERPAWDPYWTQIFSGGGTSTFLQRGGGDYYFRARACNSAGCGPYSGELLVQVQGNWEFSSFRTATPTVPLLEASSNDVSRGERTTLRWSAVEGAVEYKLEQLRSGHRPQVVYRGTSLATAQRHADAGRYGYRVQACFSTGCGAFSEVRLVAVRGGKAVSSTEGP